MLMSFKAIATSLSMPSFVKCFTFASSNRLKSLSRGHDMMLFASVNKLLLRERAAVHAKLCQVARTERAS